MVRDMILTRKGGPHISERRGEDDDWWEEEYWDEVSEYDEEDV